MRELRDGIVLTFFLIATSFLFVFLTGVRWRVHYEFWRHIARRPRDYSRRAVRARPVKPRKESAGAPEMFIPRNPDIFKRIFH